MAEFEWIELAAEKETRFITNLTRLIIIHDFGAQPCSLAIFIEARVDQANQCNLYVPSVYIECAIAGTAHNTQFCSLGEAKLAKSTN